MNTQKKLINFYENHNFSDLDKYYSWFYKKLNINYFRKWPKFLKERQVWLAYIWKNIDWEQNWDEKNFLRPVLILKNWWVKLEHITVILLTSQEKNDYFSFKLEKNIYAFLDYDSYLLLDKVKTISRKRIIWIKPLWYINKKDFEKIKQKMKKLYFE